MDKKINEVVKYIKLYYDEIESILIIHHPNIIVNFNHLYKKIKLVNNIKDDWEKIHIINKNKCIINKLYYLVKIDISEKMDISRTNVKDLELIFSNLNKIYKIFKVDFEYLYNEIINEIHKNNKLSQKDILNKFEKYPFSIDLFIKLSKDIYDIEYHKSKIINEKIFISPYFTFNVFNKTKINKLPNKNYILIKKNIEKTYLFNLPKISDSTKGPSHDYIFNILTEKKFNNINNKWEILYNVSSKDNIVLLEQYDNDTLFMLNKINYNSYTYKKIINKYYGRPITYNKLLYNNLKINTNTKNLTNINRIPYKIDINLLILNIKEKIRKYIVKYSLKNLLLNSYEFNDIILNELQKFYNKKYFNAYISSELFYIEYTFYKELRDKYTENKHPNDIIFFDKIVTVILDVLLRKSKNIFNKLNYNLYYNDIKFKVDNLNK